jgi:hypothetical protein
MLASFGYRGEQEYRFDAGAAAYLRLFPTYAGKPAVGLAKITSIFEARTIRPMSLTIGGLSQRNPYAAIILEPSRATSIVALTQGFPGGELWGLNRQIFAPMQLQFGFPQQHETVTAIPVVTFERTYVEALRNFVEVAASEMNLNFPYTIELGAVGVNGAYLGVPNRGDGQYVGPIMQDNIQIRLPLNDGDESSQIDLLRSYFVRFYDLAACSRADVLTDEIVQNRGLPPR